MSEGQVSSKALARALNEVKKASGDKKESSVRFYVFIAFFVSIIAYLAALNNRESVCNLLRTSDSEYFIGH